MTQQIVTVFYGEQYTGSNGSALVNGIGGSLVSDDGTTLKFFGPDSTFCQLAVGDWAVWFTNPGIQMLGGQANNVYTAQYVNLAAAIASYAPTGSASTLIQSSGGPVAIPASVLGQTANYDVTMSPALPNTSYKPIAHLKGAPTIVSGHSILAVTVLSTTQVRVQVQSAAASLAGAGVYVNAFALV